METSQTIRKLIAFSAVVLVGGAVPHYWWDRSPHAEGMPHLAGGLSAEALLPPSIGKFHAVDRWRLPQDRGVIEEGATYQDSEGRVSAQVDLRTNNVGVHNGLACYMVRGMTLQRSLLERVTAADSMGDFNIAFVKDDSLEGTGQSDVLIATTQCTAAGCTELPLRMTNGIQLIWPDTLWQQPLRFWYEPLVPLSVKLQTRERSQDGWDQQQALKEFRELMANFKLLPLRNLYATN